MKKRIVALLLCCVMLLTLSPNLIATAVAEDDAAPTEQVEEPVVAEPKDETKDEEPVEEPTSDAATTDETKDEELATPEQPVDPEQPTTPEQPAAPEEPKAEEPAAEPEAKTEEPVESEIVYPTVNYTDVAPFLPPVSGSPMLRAARAAANDTTGDAGEKDNGMKTSKTATANDDGSYTITLEAYATGSTVISEIKEDVPTDIILVLDQSGSMADDIGQVTYTEYKDGRGSDNTSNEAYYGNRHNGGSANLWHKLSDGSYVSVSVAKQERIEYNEITNGRNNQGGRNYTNLWDNRENLYAKVGGEYVKVSVEQYSDWGIKYRYKLPNDTVIASGGSWNSTPNISGTDDNKLYLASVDDAQTVYTYTYTDLTGAVKTIGTSTGASTKYTPAFYRRSTTAGGGSRLEALKKAATNFVTAVNKKAKGADGQYGGGDDIDHRIAVVGYAGSSKNLTSGFKQMNDASQAAAVSSAINGLTADGGTHINQGLATANGIFEDNPISATEKRNRVIIVFTDGAPGKYGDWGSESVQTANSAIDYAKTAKKSTSEGGYGATVYTIGIFSGADASNPNSLPAYTQAPNAADQVKNSNRFMHLLSSNYPAASSITQPGDINPNLNGKSYYLSANNADSLNSIFQQISSNITTGGSSTTLDEKTVIKDIISPQFTLPEGATVSDITLETWKCTGKDGDAYTWEKNAGAMGATAEITSTDKTHATTTDNQVSVTGFNFKENYVGEIKENDVVTDYRGNKLVISFQVTPRPGFLGGNKVYTNTSAGVYPDKDATDPVLKFEQPDVDVTIKEPAITLPDANVYLGAYFEDTVSSDDLKKGTTIKFGENIELDLTKPDKNWGLEDWQTEYVTIEVKVTDKDGNKVTNFEKLTEDTDYKVSVSIKPTTPKEGNNGYDKNMTGTIHVFKPELTFQDSVAYYGDNAPDFSGNLTKTEWKHGDKYSTDKGVEMLGEKPTLNISYTPDAAKLDNGKYTKQDVPVKATVKIGTDDVTTYTTFLHQNCTGKTCTLPEGYHFWIHVKTCTLSITKQGGAENEPYVFNVYKDGEKYSEVTIWGNGTETLVELPVGTYTIEEDTGWSWRYTPGEGSAVTLNKDYPSNNFICTNTLKNNYWLNGFSAVVKNVFVKSN